MSHLTLIFFYFLIRKIFVSGVITYYFNKQKTIENVYQCDFEKKIENFLFQKIVKNGVARYYLLFSFSDSYCQVAYNTTLIILLENNKKIIKTDDLEPSVNYYGGYNYLSMVQLSQENLAALKISKIKGAKIGVFTRYNTNENSTIDMIKCLIQAK